MADVIPATDEEIEFILDCDTVSADMVSALVARIKAEGARADQAISVTRDTYGALTQTNEWLRDAETRNRPTLTPDEQKRRDEALAYNRRIDPSPHTAEAYLQRNVGQLLRIIDRLTGEATDG